MKRTRQQKSSSRISSAALRLTSKHGYGALGAQGLGDRGSQKKSCRWWRKQGQKEQAKVERKCRKDEMVANVTRAAKTVLYSKDRVISATGFKFSRNEV